MKISVYQAIICILILWIIVSVFGVVHTSLRLPLETNNPRDCISSVTGQNLCKQILVFKINIVICMIVVSGMLSFKSQIVRN